MKMYIGKCSENMYSKSKVPVNTWRLYYRPSQNLCLIVSFMYCQYGVKGFIKYVYKPL